MRFVFSLAFCVLYFFISVVTSKLDVVILWISALSRLSGHATRDEIKRTALSALWVLNYRPSFSRPATKGVYGLAWCFIVQ